MVGWHGYGRGLPIRYFTEPILLWMAGTVIGLDHKTAACFKGFSAENEKKQQFVLLKIKA